MKLHATVGTPSRETETGPVTFKVDYVFTSGAARSDSVGLTIGTYYNESSMLYLLKQALLTHLRTKYAPEAFQPSDVVLF